MVQNPNSRPMKMYPTTSRATLITAIRLAVEMGTKFPSRMEIPLTPPVEKLLGSLKKYTPVVSRNTPRFTSRNFFRFSAVRMAGFPAPSSFAMAHRPRIFCEFFHLCSRWSIEILPQEPVVYNRFSKKIAPEPQARGQISYILTQI